MRRIKKSECCGAKVELSDITEPGKKWLKGLKLLYLGFLYWNLETGETLNEIFELKDIFKDLVFKY